MKLIRKDSISAKYRPLHITQSFVKTIKHIYSEPFIAENDDDNDDDEIILNPRFMFEIGCG